MTLDEFKMEILKATENKPKEWRLGQFIFNYIDEKYGVARTVQFQDGIDCFYINDKIDDFINACYKYIKLWNLT